MKFPVGQFLLWYVVTLAGMVLLGYLLCLFMIVVTGL